MPAAFENRTDLPAGTGASPPDIHDLRQEIDALDASILDLLTRRRALTERIGRVKADGERWLRLKPDREAQVLARLLDKVEPAARTLTRAVWREIMAAGLAAQEALEVVVWPGAGAAAGLLAAARSRFGAQPNFRLVDTAQEALAAAHDGASVAVLALDDPWWTQLAQAQPDLWAFDMLPGERAGDIAALAVGRIEPSALADGMVLRVMQGGDADMSLRPRFELCVQGAWSLHAEADGPDPTPERRDAGVIGRIAPQL